MHDYYKARHERNKQKRCQTNHARSGREHDSLSLTLPTILLWILVSVVSAVGNAGVPMGCYFLTLSLMSGIGAPVAILGIILPIYTIIDMVETAENVWSDSCVAALVDYDG